MGVKKLTEKLEPYMENKHLMDFEGLTLGIDGFNWLHQAAFSCCRQLCTDVPTKRYIKAFMDRLRLFEQYNAIPLIVFDGALVPSKAAEEGSRARDRQEQLKVAHKYEKAGRLELALKAYKNAFSKTPLVYGLIQELKDAGVKFLVSPYEGDAQLAFLLRIGEIDVAISDDSDLVPYGCSRVIFSMDKEGNVKYFDRSMLGQYETVLTKMEGEEVNDFSMLNDDQLRLYCVLTGYDYFKAKRIANGTIDPIHHQPYKAPKKLAFLTEMDYGVKVEKRNLESGWKLWSELSSSEPTSINLTNKHKTFKTFDDFLREYEGACLPSKLEEGDSLNCFIEGYKVTDAEGCWTQRVRPSEADRIWQYNLLALMEGQLHPWQHVLGTGVKRKGKLLEMTLWTKNSGSEVDQTEAEVSRLQQMKLSKIADVQ